MLFVCLSWVIGFKQMPWRDRITLFTWLALKLNPTLTGVFAGWNYFAGGWVQYLESLMFFNTVTIWWFYRSKTKLLREVAKLFFAFCFLYRGGHTQRKDGKSQEFSGMGYFWLIELREKTVLEGLFLHGIFSLIRLV